MNEEQQQKLRDILSDTWARIDSADAAFNMIEDLIYEIRNNAKREVE
jgi:hypothetical protein